MTEQAQEGVRGRIWLFDRRDYWRQWGIRALTQSGFAVRSWNQLVWPPEGEEMTEVHPDLVVLACSVIREEEMVLVEKLAPGPAPILILALLVSGEAMRSLFLAGAYDVADQPATPEGLVELVEQALADTSRSSPHRPLLKMRARR